MFEIEQCRKAKYVEKLLFCSADEIPSTAILTPVSGLYLEILQRNQVIRSWESPFHYTHLSLVTLRERNKKLFLICHPPGSNILSDLILLLHFSEVQEVIFLGAYGGTQRKVAIGDIILASAAIHVDPFATEISLPDSSCKSMHKRSCFFKTMLEQANATTVALQEGVVASSSSILPLVENKELLHKLSQSDIIGVDLETATLYELTQRLGVQSIAMGVVTDIPLEKNLIDLDKQDVEKITNSSKLLVEKVTVAFT